MTGAAIVGAGASIYGITQAQEAQEAAVGQQAAALRSQERIAMEQMAWQREQQAQWDDIYGPVEANLSEYYQNLTPERFEAIGVQATAQSFQGLQEQLKEQLAQRGISGSGIEAQGITDLTIAQAQQEASVRAGAEQQVAQQQQGFLSLGLGQRGQLQQGMQTAFSQQQQVGQQQYGAAAAQLQYARGSEQQAWAGLGQVASAYGQHVGMQTGRQAPSQSYLDTNAYLQSMQGRT